MLKKIVIGLLMVGFVGVLIVGAINRTISKSTQAIEAKTYSQGEQNKSGQGEGQGQGQKARGSAVEQAGTSVTAADWTTYTGAVVSVSEGEMVLETESGEQIIVEGRPWSFTQENGFVVQVGDAVTLDGFYEDNEFKVGRITGPDGQTVQLRDETGRPGWAGQGWGGG